MGAKHLRRDTSAVVGRGCTPFCPRCTGAEAGGGGLDLPGAGEGGDPPLCQLKADDFGRRKSCFVRNGPRNMQNSGAGETAFRMTWTEGGRGAMTSDVETTGVTLTLCGTYSVHSTATLHDHECSAMPLPQRKPGLPRTRTGGGGGLVLKQGARGRQPHATACNTRCPCFPDIRAKSLASQRKRVAVMCRRGGGGGGGGATTDPDSTPPSVTPWGGMGAGVGVGYWRYGPGGGGVENGATSKQDCIQTPSLTSVAHFNPASKSDKHVGRYPSDTPFNKAWKRNSAPLVR